MASPIADFGLRIAESGRRKGRTSARAIEVNRPYLIANRVKRSAFTLLEIMLAVAILAMMSLTIYRFVQSNMTALRLSSEQTASDAGYEGLVNLLTEQWRTLVQSSAALHGEAFKLENRSRDEISWTSGPGPGLLTRYAPGDFIVTMQLRAAGKNNERWELGLVRKAKDETFSERDGWVTLLDKVTSLEIRYFDSRVNSWVDRWSDTLTMPRLIKLTIGRADNSVPLEAIIALGRTPY